MYTKVFEDPALKSGTNQEAPPTAPSLVNPIITVEDDKVSVLLIPTQEPHKWFDIGLYFALGC